MESGVVRDTPHDWKAATIGQPTQPNRTSALDAGAKEMSAAAYTTFPPTDSKAKKQQNYPPIALLALVLVATHSMRTSQGMLDIARRETYRYIFVVHRHVVNAQIVDIAVQTEPPRIVEQIEGL